MSAWTHWRESLNDKKNWKLGGRRKVGGRGSERVNGKKMIKTLVSPDFKYAGVLNL
jgi:hypothetical protein